jgi:hypothetical protein
VGPASVTTTPRPAFYALTPGGWRDYVTILHLPYTVWHLSYVAIGAALAPTLLWGRLGAALAAFALALGVGAHVLDELKGRPLQTKIPDGVLWALAVISIGGAVAIGIASAIAWTLWLLPFVAFGGVVVVAYNLELFGGFFHTSLWLGLAWGALPVLSSYLVQTGSIDAAAVVAAFAAAVLVLVQRTLSTPVRDIRRRATRVTGSVEYKDGRVEEITAAALTADAERALRLLPVAVTAFALAMLLMHA